MSQLPPEAILADKGEEEEEGKIAATEKDLIEAVTHNTPFSDDLEIYDFLRMQGAAHYLIKHVASRKPDSLSITTSDSKYVEFVVSTLFSPSYLEDHAIPRAIELSNFPILPKRLIVVLHKIGEHGVGQDDFDLEEYWRLVRSHFANSSFELAAGKPTVIALVKQAMGAVADEENQDLLKRNLPQGRFEDYRKEQQLLRESPGHPLQAHGGEGAVPADEPTGSMDDTLLNLRTRDLEVGRGSQHASPHP